MSGLTRPVPVVLALLAGGAAMGAEPPKGGMKSDRIAALRKSMGDYQAQREAFSEKADQQLLAEKKIGSRAEDLIAALGHPDAAVRMAAAFMLGKRAVSDAGPGLRQMLADADPMVRLAAARALLRLGDSAGLEAVAREAKSNDATGRAAAVGMLPEFGRWEDKKARVFALLSETLGDPVKEVRLTAAAGVLLSEQPGAAQALTKARDKETDSSVRGILDEYVKWLDP